MCTAGNSDDQQPLHSSSTLEFLLRLRLRQENVADFRIPAPSATGWRRQYLGDDRSIRISMKKRRAHHRPLCHGRRNYKALDKKVRVLKALVPHTSGRDQSVGVDGLFRDTADYIVVLQMRIKIMQFMLHALTTTTAPSNDHRRRHHN